MSRVNVNELLSDLRSKTAYIEQLATDLRQNKLTDMAGLKQHVITLCQKIGEADIKTPQDKQMLENEVLVMIARLDELEAELKLYRQRKIDEKESEWKS